MNEETPDNNIDDESVDNTVDNDESVDNTDNKSTLENGKSSMDKEPLLLNSRRTKSKQELKNAKKHNKAGKSTDSKDKKKKGKGPFIIVGVLAALLVGGGIVGGTFYHDAQEKAKIEANLTIVPKADKLISYDEDVTSACKPFVTKDLKCEVKWEINETSEKGSFLKQSVKENTKVDKKSKVTLTYSNGSENITVPNVTNKTLDEAKEELYKNNITIKEITEVNSNGLEKDHVVSTDIAPDTQLKTADKPEIVVNVSNGKINVPDWTGKTKEFVEADADKNGIKVSFKEEESDQASGIVISQTPKAGDNATTNTVSVTISKAFESKDIVVPDVIGKSPEEAQSILASAGFRQINTATVQTSAVTSRQVTQVVPGVGQTGKSEENIVLIVSEPLAQ